MKKWLDRAFTGFAVLFSIPTILILISWNAIPGGFLYPVKSGLEDIALAITVKTPIASVLSLEFTDRRFNEATTLLAKEGSSAGYNLVVAEAKQTEAFISTKQDSKTADQLIRNIDEYQAKIEVQKAQIQQSIEAEPTTQPIKTPSPTIATPTPTPVSVSVNTKTQVKEVVVNQPVTIEIRKEDPVEVVATLEQTKKELETIKERVKKNATDMKKDQKHDTIDNNGDQNSKENSNNKEKQDKQETVPTSKNNLDNSQER